MRTIRHKPFGALVALGAALLLALVSAESQAWSRGYKGSPHGYEVDRGHGHHARGHGHRYSRNGYSSAKRCHDVSKLAYVHGRRTLVYGTRCYDADGRPYILHGSRHVNGHH